MPDIATISAALTSLKAATDIAKFLRESELSLEKADLKLKLADLMEALADIKMKFAEFQEDLMEKEKKIAELEEAFETKDYLIRDRDAYYLINADGKAIGVPYCLRCWESDHKKKQLIDLHDNPTIRICTACRQKYDAVMARII